MGIDISGKPVEGALGLNRDKAYYVYDFWNNRFVGKIDGNSHLEQMLRSGEARMMSVRECLDRPQVLSTNRHIMQGYLDLISVEWDKDRNILTGISKIIGGDPYTISLALNGHQLRAISCKDQETRTVLSNLKDGLIQLTLNRSKNGTVEWSISFGSQ